jgi:hypothetical protein
MPGPNENIVEGKSSTEKKFSRNSSAEKIQSLPLCTATAASKKNFASFIRRRRRRGLHVHQSQYPMIQID